jgi:predicted peptidase
MQPGRQVICNVDVAGARTIQEYLLFTPARDGENACPPILLFLHGRGEARVNRRGEYQKIACVVTRHGTPPALCQDAGWNRPFVIISPQLPHEDSRWHHKEHIDAVIRIVDDIIQAVGGDHTKVYATGFSIGGFGAIRIAADGRRRFAALLTVDAYAADPHASVEDLARATAHANPPPAPIPVWSHHAVQNPGASAIARMLDPAPREDAYYGKHPDVCRAAFARTEVYDWLLRHP